MRVVIADDHWAVREGLQKALGQRVAIVGEAETGDDLLPVVAKVAPDAVIVDISMPGLSSFDAIELLRANHPQTAVVVLTMHDRPAYVRRAMEAGASGYVLKSAGSDELIRALETAVAGGVHIQGEVADSALAMTTGGSVHLSPREVEVLTHVAGGLENKQIATALNLSEATIKSYLRTAFEKLGVASRAEAVATAIRLGFIA